MVGGWRIKARRRKSVTKKDHGGGGGFTGEKGGVDIDKKGETCQGSAPNDTERPKRGLS